MMSRLSLTKRHLASSGCRSVGLLTVTLLGAVTAGLSEKSAVAGGGELGPGTANHPVRVVPSDAIAIPSGWPLDRVGAITCLTCHTQIPTDARDPSLRDFESTPAEPIEFCARCHCRPVEQTAGSMHWLAIGVAHVSGPQTTLHQENGVLDTHTRQCLSCHDGATASESKNTTRRTGSIGSVNDNGRNHPVGILYDDIGRDDDLSPLRPASMLPQEVPLPGGRVACISCHNLYAHEPYLLTVPIDGSALCFTCHDMN